MDKAKCRRADWPIWKAAINTIIPPTPLRLAPLEKSGGQAILAVGVGLQPAMAGIWWWPRAPESDVGKAWEETALGDGFATWSQRSLNSSVLPGRGCPCEPWAGGQRAAAKQGPSWTTPAPPLALPKRDTQAFSSWPDDPPQASDYLVITECHHAQQWQWLFISKFHTPCFPF